MPRHSSAKSKNPLPGKFETAVLLTKISRLEEQVALLRESNEKLTEANKEYESIQIEDENTKEEVYAFLQKQIDNHLETIAKNELAFEKQTANQLQIQESHKLEIGILQKQHQSELARKKNELDEIKEVVRGLQHFRDERESVLAETESLREALAQEQKSHTDNVARLEMDIVQEKERLKRQMLVRIKETKINLLKMTEGQLMNTTQRTICEYDQMVSELDYQSKETEKMIAESNSIRIENASLKRESQVLEQTVTALVAKNKVLEQKLQTCGMQQCSIMALNEKHKIQKSKSQQLTPPESNCEKDSKCERMRATSVGDIVHQEIGTRFPTMSDTQNLNHCTTCDQPNEPETSSRVSSVALVGTHHEPGLTVKSAFQMPRTAATRATRATQTDLSSILSRSVACNGTIQEAARISVKSIQNKAEESSKQVLNFMLDQKCKRPSSIAFRKSQKRMVGKRSTIMERLCEPSVQAQAEFLSEFTRQIWRATSDAEASKVLYSNSNTGSHPRVQQHRVWENETAHFVEEMVKYIATSVPGCLVGAITSAQTQCMGTLYTRSNKVASGTASSKVACGTASSNKVANGTTSASIIGSGSRPTVHEDSTQLSFSTIDSRSPIKTSRKDQGMLRISPMRNTQCGDPTQTSVTEMQDPVENNEPEPIEPSSYLPFESVLIEASPAASTNGSIAASTSYFEKERMTVFGPVRPWGKRLHNVPLGSSRANSVSHTASNLQVVGAASNNASEKSGEVRRVSSAASQNSGNYLRKHNRYFQSMSLT